MSYQNSVLYCSSASHAHFSSGKKKKIWQVWRVLLSYGDWLMAKWCHMVLEILVNLSNCTKPLPETMLTNHQCGLVAFTWGQISQEMVNIYLWYKFEYYLLTLSPLGWRSIVLPLRRAGFLLAHGEKTCQIWCLLGPNFEESISLKQLGGFTPFSSMELSKPVVVQHHGLMTLTLNFQGSHFTN